MIVSMTGYGRESVTTEKHTVTVEMKSVNHRFLEISVHLPHSLLMFEDQIRQWVKRYVQRGKTDIFVSFAGEELVSGKLEVDWNLLRQYVQAVNETKEQFALPSNLTADQLLQVNEAFSVSERDVGVEHVKETLFQAVGGAAAKLLDMRRDEGTHLHDDLMLRLTKVDTCLGKLKEQAPNVVSNYRISLQKKVQDYIEGKLDIENERFLTEIAIFADKANIDEELTRLESHVKQFTSILSEGGVVGRKLNFLLQEMNREANTIGSKGNDVHISNQVVEMKSELEKMKEQIQNVE
jgi:uncharacterized protein (TIGR00255 family)